MSLQDTIQSRRSIKRFTEREVDRQQLEKLIQAAVHAPNHRLTQPWRFYVLGPDARHAYGEALGMRKAKKVTDLEAARGIVSKVAEEHRKLPAMIAVAMELSEDPEIREEDYASTFMGIQNMVLLAHEMGLGTHIRSGAVMTDPVARAAVGVAEGERIVATIQLGEPAEVPPPRPRKDLTEVTTWLE